MFTLDLKEQLPVKKLEKEINHIYGMQIALLDLGIILECISCILMVYLTLANKVF
jgi:hypothetical protein